MSEIFGWEPDAVHFAAKDFSTCVTWLRQQGGSQMRYVCSIRSNICHMVEAAGWEPDAVYFPNWCLGVAGGFKKCGLDAVPF